jgi:hypothetical protein
MFQSVWSYAEPGNKPCSQQAQKRTEQRAGHGKPERKSLLLMELFPPLHLQFEQSVSFTPAYCSDRPLGLRVRGFLIIPSEPIIAPSTE